jgi:hypothetical protein
MRGRTLDELLHHWRAVIGQAPQGFPRNFALSIQRARRNPDWQPSARQMAVMQTMVAELFTHDEGAPLFEGSGGADVDLIERE